MQFAPLLKESIKGGGKHKKRPSGSDDGGRKKSTNYGFAPRGQSAGLELQGNEVQRFCLRVLAQLVMDLSNHTNALSVPGSRRLRSSYRLILERRPGKTSLKNHKDALRLSVRGYPTFLNKSQTRAPTPDNSSITPLYTGKPASYRSPTARLLLKLTDPSPS